MFICSESGQKPNPRMRLQTEAIQSKNKSSFSYQTTLENNQTNENDNSDFSVTLIDERPSKLNHSRIDKMRERVCSI